MPRRRWRDPDPQIRDRNQLEILGAPGLAGLSRIGAGGGGGGPSNIVIRGGGGAGTEIHHVTLGATASQTIAAGGGTVEWSTVAAAPTEVRGFPTLLENLSVDGSVGAIPADLTGVRLIAPKLILDGDYTGTVRVIRTRNGADTTLEEYEGTGYQWFDTIPDIAIRPGDTTRIEFDLDADATVLWGRLDVRDDGVADSTSRAGRVIELDFAYANGVVWDGANFWVTRENSVGTLSEIVKLDADGTVLSTIGILANTTIAKGLDLLGADFLVADSQNGQVDRYDNTGTYVSSIAVTINVWGVTTDGTHLWVTDSTDATGNSGTVRKYDLTGTLVDSFTVSGRGLFGIEHNGTRLLTVDRPNHTLTAVDEDGTVVSEKSLENLVPSGVILGITTVGGVPWVLVAENPNTASRLVEII